MHTLFQKQLARATLPNGQVDIARLAEMVCDAYATNDRNRERTERSISLMVEELEERHRDLQDREAELSVQNSHFKDALDSMGQGLSMFDPQGCLIVCNENFIDMYGIRHLDPKPGVPIERFRQFFNETGYFTEPLWTLEEWGTDKVAQRELETRDGRIISVTRFMRDSGGVVLMHEDVTQHRLLERERERAETEARVFREQEYKAETANKAKSEFLAMMSHEIRTPLNAVLGLATTLLETNLNDDQRETVESIDRSGNSLLHLLNDILDFSKLDAGRMEFESIAFAPESLIDNALSIAGVRAAANNVTLRTDIAPDLPKALVGDPDRIRQVIFNLVTNAVKFTQGGEVVIGAQMLQRDKNGVTIEWWVRDSGIGISPEQVKRLFNNYVQADNSVSRRFGGTGLGLAICKRIVEQMGGDIAVTSRLGVGSTFSFRLTLPATDVRGIGSADRRGRSEERSRGARSSPAHPARRGQSDQPDGLPQDARRIRHVYSCRGERARSGECSAALQS